MTQRIVVAGASGLIGGALCDALRARGDVLTRLVRRPPATQEEVRWSPESRTLDPSVVENADCVVNLAGAGIGDKRWTPARKQEIIASRTDTTHALAGAVAASDRRPRLVVGTAVGYYGNRGEEILTEESGPGQGFLAEVVRAWEGSAAAAIVAGVPVAFGRSGIVLSPDGGAAERLLTFARLGLGGPLGSGRQFWPWITLVDEVRAFVHLIDSGLTGPVNLCAPAPTRQRDLARALGKAVGRPSVLPTPAFAVRIALGEFADDILASQRAIPTRLLADGFVHEHPSVPTAVTWLTAP